MLEAIFKYEWMQNALLAGVIIGLISPVSGIHLVVRRLAMIAEALSHVTLSGVAAGLLVSKEVKSLSGIPPIWYGMAFSVAGSLFVERIRKLYRTYQELAIPIMLSGGIGLGVVLISAADGFNVDIAGYLFGSILAVGRDDLLLILFAGVAVLLFFVLFHKEMFALSFDEEHAELSGVPKSLVNGLFTVTVSLVIAASVKVVGVLLVSALMTLPVAAALQLASGFKKTLLWSVVFSELAVFAGLTAAWYLDWASGGTIVLVSVTILGAVVGGKRLVNRLRSRSA
ncbi:metal ABC transporter permease [Staphylospora marina]|uniref:metal ABC transporter permease n=1 Tax=Staphylospora marina TaxID=2490858 RepID=UPI000F5BE994|nr:metal ABC transporter permease [Staphylospora marina]